METVYIEHEGQIQFSRTSWLEKTTEAGLKVLAVCALVQIVVFALALWGYKEPSAVYIANASNTVSILFYAVGILFAVWLRKAYKNLQPLSDETFLYKPRWAVLGFFIPFANLFVPYHMAQEIVCYSVGDRFKEGLSLVNRWWALHILYFLMPSIMIGYFSLVPNMSLESSVYIALLVSSVIFAVGTYICLSLLKFITTAQAEAFEAQEVKNYFTLKPTCPMCSSELRTFRARQCPSCFASWHQIHG
jgi:hypothetical protein